MENEYVLSILIYIFIPLIVLWYYVRLVDKMKAEKVENPPIFSLFLVLMSYTATLLSILSPFFSGIIYKMDFPIFYVYILTLIAVLFVAAVYHGRRHFSRFHSGVYKASLIYFLVVFMIPVSVFVILILV